MLFYIYSTYSLEIWLTQLKVDKEDVNIGDRGYAPVVALNGVYTYIYIYISTIYRVRNKEFCTMLFMQQYDNILDDSPPLIIFLRIL